MKPPDPPGSPAPIQASPREILSNLQRLTPNPRTLYHPLHWGSVLNALTDYLTRAPGWLARLRVKWQPYPKPFRRVQFNSADGTELVGWLGYHTPEGGETRRRPKGRPERREGILIVPGLFSSKDNGLQKARALKIFRDWGYHVFSMDLRGFGESKRTFNTAGWKEAEDVLAAVAEFRRRVPLHKLHIYAESLGASAALIAAGRAGRDGRRLIDGGLMAVAPFANARREVAHLARDSVFAKEYFMVHWFFQQLLRFGGRHYPDFTAYLEEAARQYHVPIYDLYVRSSPENYIAHLNIPTLVLHADDDAIVPRREFEDLAERLQDNPLAATWRLPWGSHCLFELLDPEWFWTVMQEFFDFCCLLPRRV